MIVTYPLCIYYDASCPLCRHEIETLKYYDVKQRLIIVDCSPKNFSDAFAESAGYQQAAMMRLIHARDAEGRWLIGVPVFEAVYAAVGITGMEKMWAHPILRPIWNYIYPWVADHRKFFSKLGVTRIFAWMVKRAAKKAADKSQACSNGLCEL